MNTHSAGIWTMRQDVGWRSGMSETAEDYVEHVFEEWILGKDELVIQKDVEDVKDHNIARNQKNQDIH